MFVGKEAYFYSIIVDIKSPINNIEKIYAASLSMRQLSKRTNCKLLRFLKVFKYDKNTHTNKQAVRDPKIKLDDIQM